MPGAGPAPNILGGRGRTAGSPLSGTGGLVAIGGRATPGGSDGPGARPGLASPAGAVCRRGGADAGAQALAGCGRGRGASALGAGSDAAGAGDAAGVAGPGAYRSAGGAGFPQPAGSAGWAGSEAFEALSAVAKNLAPGELERAAGDAGFRLGAYFPRPGSDAERDELRAYLKQARDEIATRLVGKCYNADGSRNKWWFAFEKRQFMGLDGV